MPSRPCRAHHLSQVDRRPGAGFGLPSVQVDGQDVGAVYKATAEARERAANGGGPSFIETVTYRYHGHQTNEIVNYRTADEARALAPDERSD